MSVYKETDTNTWRVIYRYTDWMGERKQTSKRGFPTKRDNYYGSMTLLAVVGGVAAMAGGVLIKKGAGWPEC